MNDVKKMVTVGGWSLIAFGIIYLGFQLIFLIIYDFPGINYGPDKEVFPLLLAGGLTLQILLTIYSLLPLLLIPASVGAYYAFRDVNEPALRVGVLFATLAALGLTVSLMRWPSLHWYLARFFGQADPGQQVIISVFFHGLDSYVGIFAGGFLSKVTLIVWFFIISFAMIRAIGFPTWIGYLGIITSVYLLITLPMPLGIYHNVISNVLNVIAPLEFIWLMLFGVSLLFYKESVPRV